ncbi:hypothetical protein [Pelagicoccus sp. SDUM812005]|uniref:hypothetical protein n=1 Tax=Pelagicoccus sp. SDUM812005 TaxID=3041257 RepID=UPI00280DC575|nr:hypothetical protein [Pelagicoccus sp. SDUM812005]MDQ8182252.1 hypothetical protein [Pelagicoccus sp. SDUM812005]
MGKQTYRIENRSSGPKPTRAALNGPYKGSREKQLFAERVAYVPGLGLVGYLVLEMPIQERGIQRPTREASLYDQRGNIVWIVPENDRQLAPVAPGEFVHLAGVHENGLTADRVLFISPRELSTSKGKTEFVLPEKTAKMNAYLFEGPALQRSWLDLAGIERQRADHLHGNKAGEHDYRALKTADGHIILALAEGEYHRVTRLSPDLAEQEQFFPTLIAYAAPTHPLAVLNYQNRDLRIETLEKVMLVPSDDVPGLFGILRPSGQIFIPDGSLGFVPIITREFHRPGRSSLSVPFTMVHSHAVAYPEEEGIVWSYAGPTGALANSPARWQEWRFVEHPDIGRFNRYTRVHPKLLVARLEGSDTWQAYIFSRYGIRWGDGLGPAPQQVAQPVGNSAESLEAAIVNAEDFLRDLNSRLGKEKIVRDERLRADRERFLREQHEKAERAFAEWARENPELAAKVRPPPPGPRAPIFRNDWQGFTYTAETTRRFEQSVRQSAEREQMRAFLNQLNYQVHSR